MIFCESSSTYYVNDDTEFLSFGDRNDDCQKLGDSAVGVDLLLNTDVECLGKTSKVNDDSQEVATICTSTRLKKLPNIKNQDFLW